MRCCGSKLSSWNLLSGAAMPPFVLFLNSPTVGSQPGRNAGAGGWFRIVRWRGFRPGLAAARPVKAVLKQRAHIGRVESRGWCRRHTTFDVGQVEAEFVAAGEIVGAVEDRAGLRLDDGR